MNGTLRICIGLLSVGSVGGGSYLLHKKLTTDNIQKKLEANNYQILSNDSKEWTEILNNYVATITVDNNSKLKFDDFDGKGDKAKEILQEKCKKIIEDYATNIDDYKKAAKWCTVPKQLSNILEAFGYRALSIDKLNEDQDKKEWEAKLSEHVKANNEDKKFENANILKTGTVKKEKENIDAIKDKCKTLNEKKHYDKDFDSDLEKAKLWCAIKKEI